MNTILNENPHTVYDGLWGGFGFPSRWQIFPHISEKNVFYREFGSTGYWEYTSVWDNDLNKWRDITVDERIKLPIRTLHPTRDEIKKSRDAYYKRDNAYS